MSDGRTARGLHPLTWLLIAPAILYGVVSVASTVSYAVLTLQETGAMKFHADSVVDSGAFGPRIEPILGDIIIAAARRVSTDLATAITFFGGAWVMELLLRILRDWRRAQPALRTGLDRLRGSTQAA